VFTASEENIPKKKSHFQHFAMNQYQEPEKEGQRSLRPTPLPRTSLTQPFTQPKQLCLSAHVFLPLVEAPPERNQIHGCIRNCIPYLWIPEHEHYNENYQGLFLASTNDNGNLYGSESSFPIIARSILVIQGKIFYECPNDQKLQQYREKQKSLYKLLDGIFESLNKMAAKCRVAEEKVLEAEQQDMVDTWKWKIECCWNAGTVRTLTSEQGIVLAKGIYLQMNETSATFMNCVKPEKELDTQAEGPDLWEGKWMSFDGRICPKWNRQNYSYAKSKQGVHLEGTKPGRRPGILTLLRESMGKDSDGERI
jgi:hypothetical protein